MAVNPQAVLHRREQALTIQRRPLTQKASQNLQSENEVHKALNISQAYTKELGISFSEHIQNFLDQCRVGLASRGLQKKILWEKDLQAVGSPLTSQEVHSQQLEFVAVVGIRPGDSKETAVGFHAQYTNQGRRTLVFKNYGCQLRLDHMQLGTSTKKDNAELAGYFGEGVKVEINCLLGAGASVEYRTGNVLWTFQYMCASGHEQPELHIISTRQSDDSEGHTTMTISFPEKGKRKHASLDLRTYLFFQDSYPALTWPLSSNARSDAIAGLEILPHPEHHRRVFAHGMPVCVEPRLKGFGLNYLGHGDSFRRLKLGRDRNSVDLAILIKAIPSAAAYLRRHKPTEHAELVKILYNTLEENPLSAVRDLMWDDLTEKHFWRSADSDAWHALIPELYRMFEEVHGAQNGDKVPSDCSQGQRQLELGYFGIQTVKVSSSLYKLFEQANLIPSIDELWQRNAKLLLDSPDATELSPEDQQHWRNELCHLFEPWVKPQKLLFKSLLPGNTEPVRALPANVYLLDANLLGINNVHELMQQDGAEECRLENCSCTRTLLIERLQEALLKKPRGPAAAGVQRTLMRRLVPLSETKARNLPPGLLSPSIEPAHDDEAVEGSSSWMPSSWFGQRSRKRGRVDPLQGPSGQAPTASRKQPTVHIQDVEHQAAPSPTDAHPIVHHKGLRDAVNGVLSGPSHGPLLMQSSRVPSDSKDTVTVTLCKSRSTDELHSSSIKLHGLGIAGSCYLYLPAKGAGQTTSCDQFCIPQNQLDGLFTVLQSLHMIFKKEGSGLPTFHVYHDRHDGIIAFNSQDEMWYNAAQDVMVQDVAARAEFWYLVICHELAHHFVLDHNSEFSDYVGKLVLEFGPRFREIQVHLAEIWPILTG